MMRRSFGLVALSLATLGTLGCSALRLADRFPVVETGLRGGVELVMFENRAAYRAGEIGPADAAWVLERHQAGAWQPVFDQVGPSWVVLDLIPGRYRVRIPEGTERRGRRVDARGWRRAFDVEPSSVTRVDAVLGDRAGLRKVLGVLGKAALVAGALAVDAWIDEDPEPYDPCCPPESLTATDVALEIVFDDDAPPDGWIPDLLSHFPRDGAVVTGDGLWIAVALSAPRPAAPSEPYPIVVQSRDGVVPGRVAYDAETWQVTWSPDGVLPASEELAVYVGLPGATDWLGTDLGGVVLFTFRTAPAALGSHGATAAPRSPAVVARVDAIGFQEDLFEGGGFVHAFSLTLRVTAPQRFERELRVRFDRLPRVGDRPLRVGDCATFDLPEVRDDLHLASGALVGLAFREGPCSRPTRDEGSLPIAPEPT